MLTNILLLLAGTAGGLAALGWARSHSRKIDRAWQGVARRTGGVFQRQEGYWHARTARRLRTTLAGQVVRVDHAPTGSPLAVVLTRGLAARTRDFTRLGTSASRATGFVLTLDPSVPDPSVPFGGPCEPGLEPVNTGDPVFDNAFVICSNDAALARVWLNDELRRLCLATTAYRFALQNDEVEAARPDLEDGSDALLAAVRATAALAARGGELQKP